MISDRGKLRLSKSMLWAGAALVVVFAGCATVIADTYTTTDSSSGMSTSTGNGSNIGTDNNTGANIGTDSSSTTSTSTSTTTDTSIPDATGATPGASVGTGSSPDMTTTTPNTPGTSGLTGNGTSMDTTGSGMGTAPASTSTGTMDTTSTGTNRSSSSSTMTTSTYDTTVYPRTAGANWWEYSRYWRDDTGIHQTIGPSWRESREREKVAGYHEELNSNLASATPSTTTTTVTTTPPMATTTTTYNDVAMAPISQADSDFLRAALRGSEKETAMAQLALNRAGSEYVKQFARRMLDDHSLVNRQMKLIARRGGIDIGKTDKYTPNEAVAPPGFLQELRGADFDSWYMAEMVKDHQNDIADFEREANNGTNSVVSVWAAQKLVTLRQHLDAAQDIAGPQGVEPYE